MTRRGAPSQGAPTDMDAALRRMSRGVLSQGGPGYLSGRFATAQPVPGSSWVDALGDDGDQDTDYTVPQWEDDDPYTLTSQDVAYSEFLHRLKRGAIVARSPQVTWGQPQPQSAYTVEVEKGLLTYPLSGYEKAGDVFDLQYQYQANAPSLDPVVPLFVASRELEITTGVGVQIAYPVGTQVGDLVILSVIAGYGKAAMCADPRMVVADNTSIPVGVTYRGAGTWVGYAADLATSLSFYAEASSDSIGQFAIAVVSAWRAAPGEPRLRYARGGAVTAGPFADDTTSQIAGPVGDFSGAILSHLSVAGVGGVSVDWGKAPAYALKVLENNSYVAVSAGVTTSNPVPSQTTPNTDVDGQWIATVIGLEKG